MAIEAMGSASCQPKKRMHNEDMMTPIDPKASIEEGGKGGIWDEAGGASDKMGDARLLSRMTRKPLSYPHLP